MGHDAKTLMQRLYPAIVDDSVYTIPQHEFKKEFRNGEYAPTYGELSFEGVEALLTHALGSMHEGVEPVFVDLGSGLGKVCMQAAITQKFSRVVGVELSGSRHALAMKALSQLELINSQAAGRVQMVSGDILAQSLAFPSPTVIFCANLTFNSNVIAMIAQKCIAELHAGSVIYSQREFASQAGLDRKSDITVGTSWSPATPLYVYIR